MSLAGLAVRQSSHSETLAQENLCQPKLFFSQRQFLYPKFVSGSTCGCAFTLSRVMALPENFEQLGEAELVWIEDDSDHLSVAGHTCKTQHTGLSSTTDTL